MGHHPQDGSYRKESRGPYTAALSLLLNQYKPPSVYPYSPQAGSRFGNRLPQLFLFPVAQTSSSVIALCVMETPIKTRRARVRKETNPQIAALKKSVSVALKAAWNVEAVKLRKEKAVRRERGTLEKKVEEQREALKAIKASVDAFLVALTPEAVITPDEATPITPAGQTLVETLAGPLSDETAAVVLDPSAAA